MRKKGRTYLLLLPLPVLALIIAILFIIRYPTDRDTLKAYFHAGPNVLELIKTLDHFRKDPDPKKYEAARFLIRHMDLHYYREDSYSDKKIRYFKDFFDSIKPHVVGMQDSMDILYRGDPERARTEKFTFFRHYNALVGARLKSLDQKLDQRWAEENEVPEVKKIRDARGIRSSFLIAHIDKAFETWNASPWCDHFSFTQFCEFFLPYKTNEGSQELWFDYYRETYGHIHEKQEDSTEIWELLYDLTAHSRYRYGFFQPQLRRNLGAVEMDQIPSGDCRLLADWQGYIFRSVGLPVAVINSVWAYAGEGHFWTAWLDKEGNWREIMERGDSIIHWEATPPKIFVRLWGKQENSFRGVSHKNNLNINDIPEMLRAWNLVDITEDIIPASNVKVAIEQPQEDPTNPFVYLAVSDDNEWEPLHWAYLEGNQAIFTQMGRNMLYLPVFYQDGQVSRAGKAFIITDEEEILNINPDTSLWITLDIDRIYPFRQWVMQKHANQMISGTLEGSMDSTFHNADTLFHIKERFRSTPSFQEAPELKGRWTYDVWWQEIKVNTPASYQYIRYRAGRDKECIIGELEVYSEDHKFYPVSFFGNVEHPEYLSDGVPGQYVNSPEPGSWAAMDLGSPQRINRIRFIPSDIDPASIQRGDEYRLFIWNGSEWEPISDIYANEKSIPLRIHPYELYLLQDLSRFVHRRPFWYNPEKGIIEWW